MIICSDSYLRLHCTSKHYYYEQDTSILGACCEKDMNLIVFLHLGNYDLINFKFTLQVSDNYLNYIADHIIIGCSLTDTVRRQFQRNVEVKC